MSLSQMPMNANGWVLHYHSMFKAVLDDLESTVTQLSLDDPRGYQTHPNTKLLASIFNSITKVVPANPEANAFRLHKTFETPNTNWRRIKKSETNCYRLFFRFTSSPVKAIVYTWFNDEDTTPKTCSEADAYEAFTRTLACGGVPRSTVELMSLTSAVE